LAVVAAVRAAEPASRRFRLAIVVGLFLIIWWRSPGGGWWPRCGIRRHDLDGQLVPVLIMPLFYRLKGLTTTICGSDSSV